jgi:small GTP-binding protein
MSATKEYTVAVLGAGAVGKTCLILRLTRDIFGTDHIATIQDYFEKKMMVDDVAYTLKIIDTAGQDEMDGITDIGIKDADAHMIVYSVTSQVSFNETERYRTKVQNLAGEKGQHLVLCGNKCDCPDRAITEMAGKDKAVCWGCPFYETSARDNINIREAFEAILKTLLPKQETSIGSSELGFNDARNCCNVA